MVYDWNTTTPENCVGKVLLPVRPAFRMSVEGLEEPTAGSRLFHVLAAEKGWDRNPSWILALQSAWQYALIASACVVLFAGNIPYAKFEFAECMPVGAACSSWYTAQAPCWSFAESPR